MPYKLMVKRGRSQKKYEARSILTSGLISLAKAMMVPLVAMVNQAQEETMVQVHCLVELVAKVELLVLVEMVETSIHLQ